MEIVEDEVAIAGGVDGVGCGRGEAELAGGDGAVESEGCAGDCAGAERAEVEAGGAVLKARDVAEGHLDVGEKPVGDEDGLGALEVGVAGHDGFAGAGGLGDKSAGPGCERVDDAGDFGADVEAQVGGDLLVAAAAGVELEAEGADRSTRASSTKWWMSSAVG